MDKQEAVKILKGIHDRAAFISTREAIETLLPELKESEYERIRREIIDLVEYTRGRRIGYNGHISQDEMVAWLEKQGEQKSVEFKWSADDKNKLLIIEQILNCANLLISSQELTEIKNWLKSLKQRIGE